MPSKTKTFNDLFGYLANKQVNVKRTAKNERWIVGSDTVANWTDTYEIIMPARASVEHNLLMAGKFAHPVITYFARVKNALADKHAHAYDVKQTMGKPVPVNTRYSNVISGALSAFEYARGAKVASQHYLNDGILQASLKALAKEYKEKTDLSYPEDSYRHDGLASFQMDLVARLLGSKPIAKSSVDLSSVTPLSDEDCEDENLRSTFTRFVYELERLIDEGEEPKKEPKRKGGDRRTDTGPVDRDRKGEPQEVDPDPDVEPDKKDGSNGGTRVSNKGYKSIEDAIERDVRQAAREFEQLKDKPPAEVVEEVDHEADQYQLDKILEEFSRLPLKVRKQRSWVPAYDMDGIVPPEFNEGSAFKTTGYVTPDAWRMSLGKTNVFDSNVDDEYPEIVVLADCSSSTRDPITKNPFGFNVIAEAIWSLSAQLLQLSPNCKSYGYSGRRYGVDIIEGQTSGKIPADIKWVAQGGTPTSAAMNWAIQTLDPEATVVVITDGHPDPSSAAFARHLRNQGNKIVTVLVTPDKRGRTQNLLRRFGSDMACVFNPTDPESIKAVSHLFAQLDA